MTIGYCRGGNSPANDAGQMRRGNDDLDIAHNCEQICNEDQSCTAYQKNAECHTYSSFGAIGTEGDTYFCYSKSGLNFIIFKYHSTNKNDRCY